MVYIYTWFFSFGLGVVFCVYLLFFFLSTIFNGWNPMSKVNMKFFAVVLEPICIFENRYCSRTDCTVHQVWQKFAPMFCSVHFSHSVMSNSLRPHGLKHVGPPCSSPTRKVYSSSCPLSRWCHPTISSSVVPFSSCL